MSDESRNRLIKLIHVGKKELGLADGDYRAFLWDVTGTTSCRDCSLDGLRKVLDKLKTAGFRPQNPLRVRESQRGGFCTEAQRSYIKGLWGLASRVKSEKSLRAMIRRVAGVGDMRFLTKPLASKVILALRDMTEKAGFDPDRGPIGKEENGRV